MTELSKLVLSLFPGIGLLDMAFEEEGFCMVRGPDVLWGGDIRLFHPPPGKFDGVIGGPPCQTFSRLRHLTKYAGKEGNLIPEFERCVREARPAWFLMENIPQAPEPVVAGYAVQNLLLDNRWIGGVQKRKRRFSFGHIGGRTLSPEVVILEQFEYAPAVLAGHGPVPGGKNPSIAEMCRLQGLPEDFLDDAPFTSLGKRKVLGNAVSLPMGRAVARAVRLALEEADD